MIFVGVLLGYLSQENATESLSWAEDLHCHEIIRAAAHHFLQCFCIDFIFWTL